MNEPPYRPIDAQVIPRFAGIRTFMRLPHVTELDGVEAAAIGDFRDGSDGTRTRDLRRDRPAF